MQKVKQNIMQIQCKMFSKSKYYARPICDLLLVAEMGGCSWSWLSGPGYCTLELPRCHYHFYHIVQSLLFHEENEDGGKDEDF